MCKYLLLIVFISSFVFSCKSDKKTEIDTVRISTHLAESPRGLTPTIYLTKSDISITSLLFLNLADYNPATLQFEPIMIKSLPEPIDVLEGVNAGSVRFDMEIIPEAKWEDGSPITGEDYLFSLKSILHPKTNSIRYRSYMNNVIDANVDNENSKKFSVFLKENSIAAMELITSFPLLHKATYDEKGILDEIPIKDLIDENVYAELAKTNVKVDSFALAFNSEKFSREVQGGNGRYKLKEWLSDQYILLERKENHWAEESKNPLLQAEAKEIIFTMTPDAAASFTQLKAGIYDIYPGLTFQQKEALESDENYRDQFEIHEIKLPRYYFLLLNTRNKKLQEKAVRQALAHLIDVDTMITAYEKGFAERINSPFLSVDSKSTLKDIEFNRAKADKLLADAGWSDTNGNNILDKRIDGELVELEFETVSTGSQLGQFISGVMKQLTEESGIKINVVNVDGAIYKQRLNNLDFDITLSGKGQSLAPYDPYPMLHTDNVDPGESNLSNFGNAETDAMINLIRSTQDAQVRDKGYLDLEKIMQEEQTIIFLYSPTEKLAVKSNLEGVITKKTPGFAINTFKRIRK